MHFVAVAVEDVPAGFVNPDAKLPAGVRKFGTNTADLEARAAWSDRRGRSFCSSPTVIFTGGSSRSVARSSESCASWPIECPRRC